MLRKRVQLSKFVWWESFVKGYSFINGSKGGARFKLKSQIKTGRRQGVQIYFLTFTCLGKAIRLLVRLIGPTVSSWSNHILLFCHYPPITKVGIRLVIQFRWSRLLHPLFLWRFPMCCLLHWAYLKATILLLVSEPATAKAKGWDAFIHHFFL